MNVNIITAKYEVEYPYSILMQEAVTENLHFEWNGLGEAVIHAPELVDSKLQHTWHTMQKGNA